METYVSNCNMEFLQIRQYHGRRQDLLQQYAKFFKLSGQAFRGRGSISYSNNASTRSNCILKESRITRNGNQIAAKRGILITILIVIASIECAVGPVLLEFPKADAEQLCGAKLVDALRFLCGERGIYNPVVKVGRTNSAGSNIPKDITVLCCQKSCTMQQLKQYCGKPAETPEQRRRQHLLHLQAILPYGRNRSRRPHGRFQSRHRPTSATAVRDEGRTTEERRTPPLTRSSRHIIREDEWERYSKMTLHNFLKAYAKDHAAQMPTTNAEDENRNAGGLLKRMTDLQTESSGS